jgi:diacylglycerol kinase family enzyme
MVVDDVTIRATRHVRASIDGELVELRSPMVYEVKQGVLNILRPKQRHAEASVRAENANRPIATTI